MRKGVAKGQEGYIVCPRDFDPPHPLDNRPIPRTEQGPTEVT
jgi:hypothetical protein